MSDERADGTGGEEPGAVGACAGAGSLAWALLNASNEMAMLLDARDGRVLALNQNMADSVGRPIAELIGTDLSDYLPPELYARRRQMGEWLVSHREPVRFEDEREGRRFLVSLTPIVDGAGEVVQIATFIRDLTEARRAEEAQRLAAIGRLSAGIAHEFNNLMASLLLAARLVPDAEAHPDLRDLVDLVVRCATNGKAICGNLTAFARQQAPGPLSPLRVEDAIEAALQLMAPRCANVPWQLQRDFASEGRQVCGDGTQLEHVFLNLLLNACQAMREGGTLTVGTRYEAAPDGGFILATVQDTGHGIAPEHLPHIFEPFFTTRGSMATEESPGAGLGLSVCYGIVERHGGTISVVSKGGQGTTFTVRLPACSEACLETTAAAAAPEDEAPLSAGPAVPGTRGRVLVAEDQVDLSRLLSRLMRAEGCEALLVRDAEQAVTALQQEPFDLVISDLVMPGGGGQRVLQAAQSLPEPPPVVVITGTMETAAAADVVSAGAACCLLKPFELSDLRRIMEELLPRRPGGEAGSRRAERRKQKEEGRTRK